jgi:hypothetical protein
MKKKPQGGVWRDSAILLTAALPKTRFQQTGPWTRNQRSYCCTMRSRNPYPNGTIDTIQDARSGIGHTMLGDKMYSKNEGIWEEHRITKFANTAGAPSFSLHSILLAPDVQGPLDQSIPRNKHIYFPERKLAAEGKIPVLQRMINWSLQCGTR